VSESDKTYKGTIAVCTPMYGDFAHRAYINTVLQLSHALTESGYGMTLYTVGNDNLVTRARNTLIHQALKTENLLGVLFLNADQGVDPDDILPMIESEKDIIGAIVPKNHINWKQVKNAVLMDKDDLASYSGDYAISFLNNEEIVVKYQEPLEVRHIGAGIMYVSAEVFSRLKPICKTYTNDEINDKDVKEEIVEFFTTRIAEETQELLAEDYTFCEMWRSLGGSVWAAPWVQSTTTGSYTFRGSFALTVDMVSRLNEISKSLKVN